jgi:hypothetical protein
MEHIDHLEQVRPGDPNSMVSEISIDLTRLKTTNSSKD